MIYEERKLEKYMVRIALDAMGGDNAPHEIVKGGMDALIASDEIELILLGRQDEIARELGTYSYDRSRVSVIDTPQVIETHEHPVEALMHTKKDSSMGVGMRLVKKGEADAFVSAGNSGALLTGGQLLVGRLKGVIRPAFASPIPVAPNLETGNRGVTLLLDCGANAEVRSVMLVQFAIIGSLYAQHILGIESPRVALVNNGSEEEKGTALTQETHQLLKKESSINFIGNIESRDIVRGYADVVVTDGFTGNAILKMYEGVAGTFLATMKSAFKANLRSKVGAYLLAPAIKDKFGIFDMSKYGGAPLIGSKGLIVKAHGNSKSAEIKTALLQCVTFKSQNINKYIVEAIENGTREA